MKILFTLFSLIIIAVSFNEAQLSSSKRNTTKKEISFEALPVEKKTEINHLLELYSLIEKPHDFLNAFFRKENFGSDLGRKSWVCVDKELNRFEVLFDQWGIEELNQNNPLLTFDFRYHLHLTDGTKCSNKYLNNLYQKYQLEKIHVPTTAGI